MRRYYRCEREHFFSTLGPVTTCVACEHGQECGSPVTETDSSGRRKAAVA